jgi:hypothetical protein
MRKLFAVTLLLASTQVFAAAHIVGRTVYTTAKVTTYPVRHYGKKTAKGAAKATFAVVKAIF